MGKISKKLQKYPFIYKIYKVFLPGQKNSKFPGSSSYWEERYAKGGNSGSGSYNRLAQFKADFLNQFVAEKNIQKVIEFGCGDGNQLMLAKYPAYIGLDVSRTVLQQCIQKFTTDNTKSFFLYDSTAFKDSHKILYTDLSLSLDVLYHLIEQEVFESYLRHLFASSSKYVIIYSSNHNSQHHFHVKSRDFTTWITENIKGFKLVDVVKNKYPFDPNDADNTSFADFYIYQVA